MALLTLLSLVPFALSLVLLSTASTDVPGLRALPFQGAKSAPRPASFDDLAARAAAARDQGQLEEALTLYRKALAARPKWDEGRWYEATLLYELDRHAEA